MKRLLTAAAITLAAFSSAASAQVTAEPVKENDDKCTVVYKLSKSVMGSRQAGVAMPTAMRIAGDNGLAREMVRDAFTYHRYTTEEYRDRTILDFANDWAAVCYDMESEND